MSTKVKSAKDRVAANFKPHRLLVVGQARTFTKGEIERLFNQLNTTHVVADLPAMIAGEVIEWNYVEDQMPDDDTTVLIASKISGQPIEGYHADGAWNYDNGRYIPEVYAWAHLPDLPPEKKSLCCPLDTDGDGDCAYCTKKPGGCTHKVSPNVSSALGHVVLRDFDKKGGM